MSTFSKIVILAVEKYFYLSDFTIPRKQSSKLFEILSIYYNGTLNHVLNFTKNNKVKTNQSAFPII